MALKNNWQNGDTFTAAAANEIANAIYAAQMVATPIKTAAYVASPSDLVPCDATSAGFTVSVPVAPTDGSRVTVKKIDSSTNVVTVAVGGSDKFNKTGGSTTLTLTTYFQTVTVVYSSATAVWYVVSDDLPATTLGRSLVTSADAAAARTAIGAASVPAFRSVSASTTVTAQDSTVSWSAITAAVTATLPSVAQVAAGTQILLIDSSGSASKTKTITATPSGSDTVSGVISVSVPYGRLSLFSDGTKWIGTEGSSGSSGATVTYGAVASTARPSTNSSVIWIGSVEPTNAIDGDVWLDTSGTAPGITTTVIDSLNVGVNTNQFLVASGTTPLIWTTSGGVLPSGLVLSTNGNLYGIPSATGSYTFIVTATNGYGTESRTYTGSVGAAVAPTITTTELGGTPSLGTTYAQLLVATGSAPVTWSVQSGTIPVGLSLDTSTGVISGTPTASGAYTFTIRATNSAGYDDQAFTGSVAGTAPSISTTSLNAMNQGSAFSQTPTFSGTTPITWSVSSGTLPTGLALNTSSGLISGTPTATGSYSFTVTATNSYGSASRVYTGSVASSTPVITTSSIDTLWRNFALTQTLVASGATPLTWSVLSGTLPTGLSLNTSTGTISGTPTTVASYSFTIRATNSYGTGDKAFASSVLQSTPAIVETSLNAIRLSTAFSQTLTLTTGGPTITWSVQSGTLPTGLSLNTSTGTISGTPTASGSYSFTIRATNGTENSDRAFTGTVAGLGPSFVSISPVMSGTSATTSVSFTAAAGSKVIVLVGYYAYAPGISTPVLTLGGVNMTNKGFVSGTYGGAYSSYMFAFEGTADGSAQQITFPAVGQLNFTAFAVAFSNVTSVGTAQASNYGGRAPALQDVTSATNHLVLQTFFKVSGGAFTGYNQTERASLTTLVVGTAPGATTVPFSATTGTQNGDQNTLCLAVDLS